MTTQKIMINSAKGIKLAGLVLTNDKFTGKRPVVLVIHGWTSAMNRYPKRVAPLVEQGYTCLLFDMRGHGETGGELTTLSAQDHHEDCLAAYDYMLSMDNLDSNNISVFGSSYGGYQAALLTSKRTVHHLVLKAPAQYDDELFEVPDTQRGEHTDNYRLQHHTPSDNMALKAINNFKGNILFIESEKDEQVPKQVMDDYREAITVKYDYELLIGADHACNVPGTEQKYIDAMAKWFERFI